MSKPKYKIGDQIYAINETRKDDLNFYQIKEVWSNGTDFYYKVFIPGSELSGDIVVKEDKCLTKLN